MIIVGINAYHGDSSACLLRDGELVAAAEEERFRRVKHWAGFPAEAIRYCLDEAGIGLDQVDHIAINQDPSVNFWKKLRFAFLNRPDFQMVLDRVRNKRERSGVEKHLEEAFPNEDYRGKLHYVEHHIAHLSSAFHVSPFEEAVAVSVDGFGDFSSAAWGVGRGTKITVDGRVFFPHSLGIFYQAITQFIGFPNYGDEYKMMGLAPYGRETFVREMEQIVLLQDDGSFKLDLKYFRHHNEKIDYEWTGGSPSVGRLFGESMANLLGPARTKDQVLEQRHMDLARSAQAMYEKAFFHLLNTLHARYGLDSLALAGGCAMNSVANGKITLNTPFKNVYIQSAAGDAGGAVGAAYTAFHNLGGVRGAHHDHAYWGPGFSDEQIKQVLDVHVEELSVQSCKVELVTDEDTLCQQAAAAISKGLVVGWFQGRMEWGPRALGNRSILGDPRRADMKDILNLKIKRRESFRPFAPSVLRDAVGDWFETDSDVPFMMQVYQIRQDKRAVIPAVTHVDGSGRLQTVSESGNRRYYKLIREFNALTGVPMVLNTSFNENEPVVCTPQEALDCFLRTKMDVLVMGSWLISRSESAVLSSADSTQHSAPH